MQSDANPYQPPLAESEIPIAPKAEPAEDKNEDLGYLLMTVKAIGVVFECLLVFTVLAWAGSMIVGWLTAWWNGAL